MLLMVEFCERGSTLGLINMEYIFAKKSEKQMVMKILYMSKSAYIFNVNKNRNLLIISNFASARETQIKKIFDFY